MLLCQVILSSASVAAGLTKQIISCVCRHRGWREGVLSIIVDNRRLLLDLCLVRGCSEIIPFVPKPLQFRLKPQFILLNLD